MKKILALIALLVTMPLLGSDMTHSPCFQSGNLVKCYPATGVYLDNSRSLRLGTNDTTHYVEQKAANSVATSYTLTWPASVAGTAGSVITTATDGTLAYTAQLPIANGGTGQATKAASFDALSPMSAAGDLIYGGASGTGTRLAKGTSLQLLHSGTAPTFSAVDLTADVANALPLLNGGTGTAAASANAAFNALSPMTTAGDILYGGTSGAGTRLAKGTSLQVLHSGTTPTFSAVNIASGGDVTGTLPVANGGIGIASGNSGGFPYFSSTTTISSTALLTAHGILLGQGAGASPTALGVGTTGQVLRQVASADPAWAFPHTTVASATVLSANAYTITDTDGYVVFLTTTGTNTITYTLPAAANNANRRLVFKKVDTGNGKITINRAGSDTIDGYTTTDIGSGGTGAINNGKNAVLTMISDGTTWQVESVMGEVIFNTQTPTTTGVLSTGSWSVASSVNLGNGTWVISGAVLGSKNGAVMTGFNGAVSLYGANLTTDHANGDNFFGGETPTTTDDSIIAIPGWTTNIASGAITAYLKAKFTYSAGTPQMGGKITAVRVR